MTCQRIFGAVTLTSETAKDVPIVKAK